MKLSRITTLIILFFTLFALTLPTFAQDATAEVTPSTDLQTYTTENRQASVQFPAGWVFEKGSDSSSILSVKLASNQSALGKDLFNLNDVFQPGEVHIEVATIGLSELIGEMPTGTITMEATPLELVQVLAKQGMPDEFKFGDPGAITINDDPAVRMNLTAEKRGEGQLLLTINAQKWVEAIILFAAPGEGDKWDLIARNILASIQIAPSAEVTSQPTLVPTNTPPTDVQNFISSAGGFKVSYPIGWNFDDRSDDTSDDVVGGVFASNPDAQYKQLYSSKFNAGDIRIEFVLPSLDKLSTLPTLANIDASTSVTKIMQAFVDAKIVSESLNYGEVQSTTFEGGTAAQVELTSRDNNGDGRMLFINRDDGVNIYFLIYTADGDIQSGDVIARQIAASVVLNAPIAESTLEPTAEATSDGRALTQTAKTANGLASLSYPATWFSRQSGSESIYVANTQSALDKSFGSSMASGEVNILVIVSTTAEFMKQAQVPLTADASPLKLLQITIEMVGDSTKFGTPQAASINGKSAASVDFTGQGFEGTAWIIEYQKGEIIVVQLLTASGESSQWQSTALAIIASVKSAD